MKNTSRKEKLKGKQTMVKFFRLILNWLNGEAFTSIIMIVVVVVTSFYFYFIYLWKVK